MKRPVYGEAWRNSKTKHLYVVCGFWKPNSYLPNGKVADCECVWLRSVKSGRHYIKAASDFKEDFQFDEKATRIRRQAKEMFTKCYNTEAP